MCQRVCGSPSPGWIIIFGVLFLFRTPLLTVPPLDPLHLFFCVVEFFNLILWPASFFYSTLFSRTLFHQPLSLPIFFVFYIHRLFIMLLSLNSFLIFSFCFLRLLLLSLEFLTLFFFFLWSRHISSSLRILCGISFPPPGKKPLFFTTQL